MSTDNIRTFLDKASTDSALQARVAAAYAAAQQSTAAGLAQLAAEAGTPFTAEEFLTFQKAELSEQDLAGVAGGVGAGLIQKGSRHPAYRQSSEEN